jgi:purine-binding chemotaxis protein CheW
MDAQTSNRSLNKAVEAQKSTQHQAQFLTFVLGAETYCIDILRVQEIRGWERTTQLPETPAYVKGVINIRGTIVPIVDLRERFHIGQATYNDSTVVIITKMEGGDARENLEKTVGLVVDGVSDVEDIDLHSLQAAPSFKSGDRVSDEFIQGLASVGDKMAIVLNVDHLLHKGVFQKLAAA